MKTTIIIVLVGICSFATAQFLPEPLPTDYIEYKYDNAGNRIQRKRVLIFKKKLRDVEVVPETITLVYPNPNKGEFKIDLELEEKEVATAEIYDNQGRQIKRIDITNNSTLVDISSYSDGTYFLKVYRQDEVEEWKIIKQY